MREVGDAWASAERRCARKPRSPASVILHESVALPTEGWLLPFSGSDPSPRGLRRDGRLASAWGPRSSKVGTPADASPQRSLVGPSATAVASSSRPWTARPKTSGHPFVAGPVGIVASPLPVAELRGLPSPALRQAQARERVERRAGEGCRQLIFRGLGKMYRLQRRG